MVNKFMFALAIFVSILPINALRIFFFRNLRGYNIDYSSKVGMFSVISCETVRFGRQVKIGRFNRFVGPFSLEIGDGEESSIRMNLFVMLGPSKIRNMQGSVVLAQIL